MTWDFDEPQWRLVRNLLALQWSPDQIAGRLKVQGKLSISHKTRYRRIWRDQHSGGALNRELLRLMRTHGGSFKTVTADIGTEPTATPTSRRRQR